MAAAAVAMAAAGVSAVPAAAASAAPAAATSTAVYSYVVNYGSNNVSVLNTATNKVTATISVGLWPLSAVTSPNHKYVYVTDYGDCQSYSGKNPGCVAGTGFTDSNVDVISTSTNTVTKQIVTGLGPAGAAVTPAGVLYVTNFGANSGAHATIPANHPGTVTVYNPSLGKVTATITVGHQPAGVTVSKSGKYVYVTNVDDSTISVIAVAANKVVNTVKVADGVLDTAVSPATGNLYVTSPASANVSVFHPGLNGSLTPLTTFSIGTGVTGYVLAFSPSGNDVYITSNNAKSQGFLTEVSTANNKDNKVVKTTPTAFKGNGALNARGISVSPNGQQVYVANYGVLVVPSELEGSTFPKGNETVFSSSDTAVKALAVGQGPAGATIVP